MKTFIEIIKNMNYEKEALLITHKSSSDKFPALILDRDIFINIDKIYMLIEEIIETDDGFEITGWIIGKSVSGKLLLYSKIKDADVVGLIRTLDNLNYNIIPKKQVKKTFILNKLTDNIERGWMVFI